MILKEERRKINIQMQNEFDWTVNFSSNGKRNGIWKMTRHKNRYPTMPSVRAEEIMTTLNESWSRITQRFISAQKKSDSCLYADSSALHYLNAVVRVRNDRFLRANVEHSLWAAGNETNRKSIFMYRQTISSSMFICKWLFNMHCDIAVYFFSRWTPWLHLMTNFWKEKTCLEPIHVQ